MMWNVHKSGLEKISGCIYDFIFSKPLFSTFTKFRANFQKIKNLKYLNASIDFGQIQDQRSSLDVLYLCAVLGQ